MTSQLSSVAQPLIGTVLDGRFRIDRVIGQGGMGMVFAATQLSVDRQVAVKVLRHDMSETSQRRFMREAKVISQMSHANIVQLIDFGRREEDQLLYLVMEYVEGVRLSDLLKRGRLDASLALECTQQICSALAEAHAQGIIHRDLKPGNILLVIGADGSVQLKVLDFGIAHTYADADRITATGVMCGTPAYMAPEQARSVDISLKSDLYAVGVTLYEMLCGFRPFTGETPVEVVMKHIQMPAPSLHPFAHPRHLPKPVIELVEHLMQKQPEHRPPSAGWVRQRVMEIRRETRMSPIVIQTPTGEGFRPYLLPAFEEAQTYAGEHAETHQTPRSHDGARSHTSSHEQMRHGGGWTAFNQFSTGASSSNARALLDSQFSGFGEPSKADHLVSINPDALRSLDVLDVPQTINGAQLTPVDEEEMPTAITPEPPQLQSSGSFMSTSTPSHFDEDAHASQPSPFAALEPSTLVVDRPHPQRTRPTGTSTMADVGEERLSAGEALRFVLVAVFAFLVVVALGAVFLGLGFGEDEAGIQARDQAAVERTQAPQTAGTPSQSSPDDAPRERAASPSKSKPKPRAQKKSGDDWQMIDLFEGEEPPEQEKEEREVIIEHAR